MSVRQRARTLLDYFAHRQLRTRAFDTEVPKGTLKRFYPDVANVVDINHVPDHQVDLASVPFATFIANKKQSGDPPLMHSCCGAMSVIGSTMSGASTTAPVSPT